MKPEKLQQLKESQFAQTIIEWFNEEIAKLDSTSNSKDWTDVLGKRYAIEILKELMRSLEVKPEKQKKSNQYQ